MAYTQPAGWQMFGLDALQQAALVHIFNYLDNYVEGGGEAFPEIPYDLFSPFSKWETEDLIDSMCYTWETQLAPLGSMLYQGWNDGTASALTSLIYTVINEFSVGGGAALAELPAGVVSYYPVNEGSGTTLTDTVGGLTADLTSGGGTVAWNGSGWLQLTNGWFKTPSRLTQNVVVLFRCAEGYTNYNFAAPDNDALGNGYYAGGTKVVRTLHGWGVADLARESDGSASNDLLAGGWVMASLQTVGANINVSAIGAGSIGGAGPVGSMEVAGIAIFAGTATDAELLQLRDYVAQENKARGIYVRPQDCPTKVHLAIIVGESTSEGTYPLASLSAPQRAATNANVLIEARNTASNAATGRTMQVLSLAAGTANNNPTGTAGNSGLEVGILNTRIGGSGDGRALHILKVAQGSTWLVPADTYTNAAGGSTVVIDNLTRSAAAAKTAGIAYLLEIRNAKRMEAIARNSGIGYSSVSVVYNEGLNDAYIGTDAVPDAATYQGYLQARYDELEELLGIANLKVIAIKPHEPLGGLGAGDPDYPNNATGTNRLTALGYIRTAFDSFHAANSADVSLLDGNSYALDTPGDYVHPSAAGYDAMGDAAEGLFAYSTLATPRG